MHRRFGASAATAAALTLAAGGLVAPAAQAAEELPSIAINEVESSGGDPVDWIELTNIGDAPVDVSGWILKDSDDSRTLAIAAGTVIQPGGFLAVDVDVTGGFGLGGADAARVFLADGTTLVDSYEWAAHAAGTTYGACPDGSDAFALTLSATKGAANDCEPTEPSDSTPTDPADVHLTFNEVESNGDDTDWVEVMNLGTETVNLSGYLFVDNAPTLAEAYALPAGTTIEPGGLLVIDQASGSNPEGFTFGPGNPDEPRLFAPDGTTLVASHAYPQHALVSWSRCEDGTGEWIDAPFSTKGEPNFCGLPVRINEVESSGDTTDWVELVNLTATTVDLSGVVIKDNDDTHALTLPEGTTLAPNGFAAFDTDADDETGFGLGGGDAVRVFANDGALVDSYAWSVHAGTTYGRCPDGLGKFEATASSTKGATNDCAGIVNATAWPGGAGVEVLDAEDTFTGDMSGIDFSDGKLWAVQNGDGLLYRMSPTGEVTGQWSLTYPDGVGTVDSEGVHVAADGAVFVSSERNNAASGVSRPAVLRYEVSGTSGTLTATDEWNLAADFPGLPANGGLEGITWIPDSWLVNGGLIDAQTSEPYAPENYPGHGDGLFAVAVEGTASVYLYALAEGDGSLFARIATVSTESLAFGLVADVQFDAERDQLWVACDEACEGRIAAYTIDEGVLAPAALYERPAGMANIANEGFAVADASLCAAGSVPTFYVDDADTDGFSLRSGTLQLDCDELPALEAGRVGVAGTARVGAPVRAFTAGWPAGATLSYQWLVNGKPVEGATGERFTPTTYGSQVSVTVTASKAGYSDVSATSAEKKVAAGILVPGDVAVVGTVKVGAKVVAVTTDWPAGATRTYQWKADGKVIAGATAKTLKIPNAAKGKRLTVTVTAKQTGYAAVTVTSAKTIPVR